MIKLEQRLQLPYSWKKHFTLPLFLCPLWPSSTEMCSVFSAIVSVIANCRPRLASEYEKARLNFFIFFFPTCSSWGVVTFKACWTLQSKRRLGYQRLLAESLQTNIHNNDLSLFVTDKASFDEVVWSKLWNSFQGISKHFDSINDSKTSETKTNCAVFTHDINCLEFVTSLETLSHKGGLINYAVRKSIRFKYRSIVMTLTKGSQFRDYHRELELTPHLHSQAK